MLCASTLAVRLTCAPGGTGDEGITSAGQLVFFTGIGTANGLAGNTGDVIFTGNLLPGQSAIFGTLQDISTRRSAGSGSLAPPRYSAPAFSALPSIASACGDAVVSPRG